MRTLRSKSRGPDSSRGPSSPESPTDFAVSPVGEAAAHTDGGLSGADVGTGEGFSRADVGPAIHAGGDHSPRAAAEGQAPPEAAVDAAATSAHAVPGGSDTSGIRGPGPEAAHGASASLFGPPDLFSAVYWSSQLVPQVARAHAAASLGGTAAGSGSSATCAGCSSAAIRTRAMEFELEQLRAQCVAAESRAHTADSTLAQLKETATERLVGMAHQMATVSRQRDDLQAHHDARVAAFEAELLAARAVPGEQQAVHADRVAALEAELGDVNASAAVLIEAIPALREVAVSARAQSDAAALALESALAEVAALRESLCAVTAELRATQAISTGAGGAAPTLGTVNLAASGGGRGTVGASKSPAAAAARDVSAVLDALRRPHQAQVDSVAAPLRQTLVLGGTEQPVADLLASGAAAMAVGAFPDSPALQRTAAAALAHGAPGLVSTRGSLADRAPPGSTAGLLHPPGGAGGLEGEPVSGARLSAHGHGVRRGLGLGLVVPSEAGRANPARGAQSERESAGSAALGLFAMGGASAPAGGLAADHDRAALAPRLAFLGSGVLPDGRVAAPTTRDEALAPLGFTDARLADGTPLGAVAEAVRVMAHNSVQNLHYRRAKDENDQHDLEEKHLKQTKDSLSFQAPTAARRVQYMGALGEGDTADFMCPTLHAGVYAALSRRFVNHKENFALGVRCVVTRRLLYALTNGLLGSGPRSVDACDVRLLTLDSMLAEPAVDFTIQKVEPRGDPNAQDAVTWYEAVKMLAKLLGWRFGKSYFEVGILAFAGRLWAMHIGDPGVWTLHYIKCVFTDMLDKFTRQVDTIVSDLEELHRSGPGGDQPLSSHMFLALLMAPGSLRSPPSAFSTVVRNHMDDVVDERRDHVARIAAKEATAAGAGTVPARRDAPESPRAAKSSGPGARESKGGGRASGLGSASEPAPSSPAEPKSSGLLTALERAAGFAALSAAACGSRSPCPEVCVRASTHKMCPGEGCGRSHEFEITRAMLGDLPYQAQAIIIECGGLLTEPLILKESRRGRIEQLRLSAAERVAGSVDATSFFRDVLSGTHALEDPLRAVLTGDASPSHLFNAIAPPPLRYLEADTLTPIEERALSILTAVRPVLGDDVPDEISAWAAAFVARGVGDIAASDAGFVDKCQREVLAGLRLMVAAGVPRLRQFAQSVLPEHRAGGSALRAFWDGCGPSVVVHPTEPASGSAKYPSAAVFIFDVPCKAWELGDAFVCNGRSEHSQCLILTCAEGAGDDPANLLTHLRAQASAAIATAATESSFGPIPVAYAAALAAAHDLCSGHSHDCHCFTYFWPRSDPRYANNVLVWFKLRTGGRVVVDVLDLRLEPNGPPSVIAGLLLDGHARLLTLPEQWQGEAGLAALLRAARNRGIVIEKYGFTGVAAARSDSSGLVVGRRDRTPCEFCNAPCVRSSLCGMVGDVAGRARPAPPFESIHPDILVFAQRAARESEESPLGSTTAGCDEDGITGAQSEQGASVYSGKGKQYDAVSFADIASYRPSGNEADLALQLVALSREPVGNEREIITDDGPARRRFLKLFRQVVETWDSLLLACGGDYRKAAMAFRSQFLVQMPATMDAKRFNETVAPFVPPDLAAYGAKVQAVGVRMRLKRDATYRSERKAAPPNAEGEIEVFVEIFKDFQRGGIVVASKSKLAREQGYFDDVQESPLLRVPKKNMDGTESEEGRIVHHQSFPKGGSTNDAADMEEHPPSRPPTHATLIRLTLLKIASNPGIPILFAKRDAKAAFKRCFLQIASINWFASTIRGTALGIADLLVVIWLTLTFGYGGSPGEYGMWPTIIDAAHQNTAPPRPEINGSAPFTGRSFVDDGILVEADMGARLKYAVKSYHGYLEGCLGVGAVNEKKLAEEGAWEPRKINWGIVYDTTEVTTGGLSAARLELPSTKLQKACAFMSLSAWRPGNRVVTTRDVQRLSGNVLFWSTVAYPLRLALHPFWALTAGAADSVWAAPAGSPEEQEEAWEEFEMSKEFVKVMVLQRDQWKVSFTSPMTFGLDPQELLLMPGGPKHIFINGDASGSEERFGDVVAAVDLEAGTWHAEHMNKFAGPLGRVCGRGRPEKDMSAADFIIFVKELTALAALVVQHGHLWVNKLVIAAWDNMNVVQVMGTRRSRNSYVRYLLAIITRLEIKHKFSVIAVYINTHNNHPADDISRLFGTWLKDGREGAVARMQAHLDKDPRWKRLKYEPMTGLLDFLTDERHALKSFTLPDEALNPHCVAYQLAQARQIQLAASLGPADDAGNDPTGLENVAVIELRAGLGQLAKAAKRGGASIHGLVEPDPVARDVLRVLFPESSIVDRVEELEPWSRYPLVVLATFVKLQLREAGVILAKATQVRPALMMVIILDDLTLTDGEVRQLDDALEKVTYRRTCEVLSLNAANYGAAQVQHAHVICYGKSTGAMARQALPRLKVAAHRAPGRLRDCLRTVQEVPQSCSLDGVFKGGRGGPSGVAGTMRLGTISLGGPEAGLFQGSLVKVKGERTTKWRVSQVQPPNRVLAVEVGGSEPREIYWRDVRQHLVQRLGVFSIDGPGNAVQVTASTVAGPGGTIIFDDRMEPQAYRPLLDDECMRVQGHSCDVMAATLSATLSATPSRRAGLAGRGVAVVVAQVLMASLAHELAANCDAPPAAAAQDSDLRRYGGGPQRLKDAVLRSGQRGVTALANAEAELFRSQLSTGSHIAYDRGFRYWWLWCMQRGRDPFMRGGSQAFQEESELISFYAYFGVICQYAYSTIHVWLHGIQHTHILRGLGDPLFGKLRLRLVRKGFKRLDKRQRGATNKLAATIDLILEVVEHGGLDYSKWDDAVLAAAIIFGFFKLRRCGEFLRSGEHPDGDKCVRVGDCTMAREGVMLECAPGIVDTADELIAVQRLSKADQEGRGAVTRTFCMSDERLCVVAWFKRLIRLKPGHFKDPTRFLFTLSDGRVLERGKVAQTLKEGAARLGHPVQDISVISLRAGGASCMYHAGFSTEEIQRRGRWASDAYKVYLHEGRTRARDVAERMASAGFSL